MNTNLILFVVGPTASGKSSLAIELAKQLDGEVISADSMQIYQRMDVGTAKPSKKDQKKIPHHGINLIPPSKKFSVYAYRQYALKTIRAIIKRGKVPIVAGGTGFYIRALLEGLSPQPAANPKIRCQLEQEALKRDLPALYARLCKVDPLRARQIGPDNGRRIIRALEIYQTSGKKPSDVSQKSPGLAALGYQPIVIGIHRDRQALYHTINQRVDQMFRKGLVNEVKRLARKKISETALQGVGYKEVLEYLSGHCEPACPVGRQGEAISCYSKPSSRRLGDRHGLKSRSRDDKTLLEVKDKIKQTTRHFAKRQWTWFKREKGIRWIWWPEGVSSKKIGTFVVERFLKNQ